MNKLLSAAAAAAIAASFLPSAVSARPMTATDLATIRRLASPTVSPDGRWVAYQLSETDLAANKGLNDLWLLDMRTAGASPAKIASAPDKSEHDPHFSADGRSLYYLGNASGSDQLWRVTLPGGTPEQLTHLATDVAGFLLSPAGDRIAIWGDRNLACADFDCAPELEAELVSGVGGNVFQTGFDALNRAFGA